MSRPHAHAHAHAHSHSPHDSGVLIPGLDSFSTDQTGSSTPPTDPYDLHHHHHNHQPPHPNEEFGISSMISGWFGRTFGPTRSSSNLDASMHSSRTFPSDHPSSFGDGISQPFTPPRLSRPASPFVMPDYEPLVLTGYRQDTDLRAQLLSTSIGEAIRVNFPERLRICEEWKLVYSLYQNGSSLSTLYKLCDDYRGRRVGFVLVVRDGAGGVSPFSSPPFPLPLSALRQASC